MPDLCAQGRSGDRDGPLTYHAMAEDVVALLDRLDVEQADVWGWSDGGAYSARVSYLNGLKSDGGNNSYDYGFRVVRSSVP